MQQETPHRTNKMITKTKITIITLIPYCKKRHVCIDGVNARRSFDGHAVRHQQVQQEMGLSRDEESENDSISSERVRVVDSVQQFQREIVSSDEESENDSTPSPAQVDAVQQKSGNERKRRAPIRVQQSFDDRVNDIMAFKAKYGHCDVPRTGENASLGQWCSERRVSYKKIQNYHKPRNKLSDEQIQRLNDARVSSGFYRL
jgi:hypothetical protein